MHRDSDAPAHAAARDAVAEEAADIASRNAPAHPTEQPAAAAEPPGSGVPRRPLRAARPNAYVKHRRHLQNVHTAPAPRAHGDPATTGRSESASERRRRKRAEARERGRRAAQ